VGDAFVGVQCQFWSCAHFDEKFKVIETLQLGHPGGEIQPAFLIADGSEISIVREGAVTLTFFVKEATWVASAIPISKNHHSIGLFQPKNCTSPPARPGSG
jgi:hypothetical protein